MSLSAVVPPPARAVSPTAERKTAREDPLLTRRARMAIWDWAGDQAFGAAIGACTALAIGYGVQQGKLNATMHGFERGNLFGGLATVVVGQAIFLYLGRHSGRFPFIPDSDREKHAANSKRPAEPEPRTSSAADTQPKVGREPGSRS